MATTTTVTPTSLSSLEQYTWASPLAPSMEPDEYVFILSCLQPFVDMTRLCRMAQRKQLSKQSSPSSIVLALSCMNQYELRRSCQDWRAIIVHIDPECTALQRSVAAHDRQSYLLSTLQTVIWGSVLAAVGWRQNSIIRYGGHQWSTRSRFASVCAVVVGYLLAELCAKKTLEVVKAIPHGYDVVKVRDEDAGTDHLFLVRRDYARKNNMRIVPMYLLSGLGLGTMLLGARIALKIRKIAT